jgi:ABC-type antimicrobial peptide transport system permease subunit
MLQNYLKIAWRNLLKSKVTSFINIAGLSVGMAVAMIIGLWMFDELSFNKVHQHYDSLAQLYLHQQFNDKRGTSRAISLPTEPVLRNEFGSDFNKIALASWSWEHLLTYGEKKLMVKGMNVQPDFPEMLSLQMLKGQYESALKEPNAILVAESLAKAFFGEDEALGKTIRLDQQNDMKVTGVFKDLPHNSSFHEDKFYVPWAYYMAQNPWVKEAQTQWGNHSFQLFAQIADHADFEKVSAKIKDIELKNNKDGNPGYFLFPMSKWHLHGEFKNGVNVGGRIQFVWLFGIIGVFVLLLACINFMNLSTARSEKRAKEVGIRKSIGSMRGQLIGQFLSESLLVAFLSLVLSVALVQFALAPFNRLAGKQVSIPWGEPLFWLSLLGFAALTGILAGSYPAFYLSSFDPLKVLKGTFRAGRWASLPRQALVIVQFTVSVALIIGTLVVFKQIQFAKNRPVGYDREGILQTSISPELYDKFEVLRDDLLKSGMVIEASQSSSPVTDIYSNQIGFTWEGKDPNTLPLFGIVNVTADFGKTVNWQIKEGRDFSRDFPTDTASLILNEAGVELTGLDNIVGKTIRWDDQPFQVIGVIKNMIMESPYAPVKPTIFCMAEKGWVNNINIRLKPGVPVQDALAGIEAIYKKHAPGGIFDYRFVDDEYDNKFESEERIGKLARVFAILAIFISCLGLFGLSAYVAEQRTKEIGIRKVLGATVGNLWAMQSKGFLGLVIVSCAIATPLAWYFLKNWLSDYEYRIEIGWEIFCWSALLALLVTLLTVSFQSVKAALANPVKSLRSE